MFYFLYMLILVELLIWPLLLFLMLWGSWCWCFGFVNVSCASISLDQTKIMKKLLISIVSSTDGKNIFVLQICFYQKGCVKFFWFWIGMSDFVSILFLNWCFCFWIGMNEFASIYSWDSFYAIVLKLLGIWGWDELNPSFGFFFIIIFK